MERWYLDLGEELENGGGGRFVFREKGEVSSFIREKPSWQGLIGLHIDCNKLALHDDQYEDQWSN